MIGWPCYVTAYGRITTSFDFVFPALHLYPDLYGRRGARSDHNRGGDWSVFSEPSLTRDGCPVGADPRDSLGCPR